MNDSASGNHVISNVVTNDDVTNDDVTNDDVTNSDDLVNHQNTNATFISDSGLTLFVPQVSYQRISESVKIKLL
jgi:hypothetical protein